MAAEPSGLSARDIIDDFNQRTRGAWSTETRYAKVTVLLIAWADDDLGVASEIDRLQLLFQKDFNFEIERFSIPSENPAAELSDRLSSFVKNHSLDHNGLTILYYGGHADNTAESVAGYPEWRA
jgi:hypothetical protein